MTLLYIWRQFLAITREVSRSINTINKSSRTEVEPKEMSSFPEKCCIFGTRCIQWRNTDRPFQDRDRKEIEVLQKSVSFLRLCSYYMYRRFVKGFAEIARPLHRLTEKTQEFVWTPECDVAFTQLVRHLILAPILTYILIIQVHLFWTQTQAIKA